MFKHDSQHAVTNQIRLHCIKALFAVGYEFTAAQFSNRYNLTIQRR